METRDVYTFDDLKEWAENGPGDLSPRPVLAVFGDPVAHSRSPQMMNPGLAAKGIEGAYVRLHIKPEELKEALRLLPSAGFYGTNVTIPHKQGALAEVDQLDSLAKKLGVVNTVVVEEDQLLGFNSDGPGFVRAIREEFSMDVRDLRILILGAGGGAGRAVAIQCAAESCERLVLVNRTQAKADVLAKKLEDSFEDEKLHGPRKRLVVCPWEEEALAEELGEIDLIVNATSLGMKRLDPDLLTPSLIQPHHLVYDMIYSPQVTKLMRTARENGARAANGLSMLLHQGAISFETWFNCEAPLEAMRSGLMESL